MVIYAIALRESAYACARRRTLTHDAYIVTRAPMRFTVIRAHMRVGRMRAVSLHDTLHERLPNEGTYTAHCTPRAREGPMLAKVLGRVFYFNRNTILRRIVLSQYMYLYSTSLMHSLTWKLSQHTLTHTQ